MLTSSAAGPPITGEATPPSVHQRRARFVAVLVAALALLALVVAASLLLGVRTVAPGQVWAALLPGSTGHDPGNPDQAVVLQLRVPRTVLGLLAGLALGCVGTVIQGVTRNPIADPGLLGITPGASLAVVAAVSFLGVSTPLGFVWFAFAGAALAAVVVFAIGHAQPVRLALVGAALTAFVTPVIALLLLRDVQAFDQYRFWAVGSLAARGLDTVAALWPFLAVGVVLTALLAPRLTLLSMGDDVAAALGQDVRVTRGLAAVAIVVLAGTATAFAGPIALVGLVVPHAARRLVGSDYRRLTPVAAVLGPAMLLGADVVGRLVVPNSELEAGVVAAFVGAPVLVAVARGRSVAGV
ncbi:iron ABC transporter permease [Xylanimonas allomyrinae]|uniref:Iron ABC transporter permease n=1 Tax=Xylanimonas allomyrinae TaxID=2509459 RepID=A0A4P6EKB2_9MICO|nr:iron ABC transporter permease [Xylanimonas allomyrinae]QAY63034.1 iron ABC transporter permease [Xylanimonas allomyrinae]